MNKAYKFRIYPNSEQQLLFEKTFGCVRFIYNKMLADKIEFYKETKQKLNNTPAQYKKEFEWLKEVDSLALANAQMNLQSAYNNFFRNTKVGFPKFKSKKHSKNTYTTNNQKGTISLLQNKLKLPKVGYVKIKQHRQIPSDHEIKSATISKTASGKYYVSILTEYVYDIPKSILSKDKALGLDYASHSFYVDSQGREANYPRFYRNTQDKLAKEQRKLANMKYGSSNYQKQKVKIATIHEHIANQRKDWLHKLSTELSKNYDYICVENLNMKDMSQCLKLGKSTMDNGWGMFTTYLKYKLEDMGKQLVKVDKFFASSQICNVCGYKNSETKDLAVRSWDCPQCGTHHDRDINAAINIRNEVMRIVTA